MKTASPESFKGILDLATNRMLSALSAFYIWKWLNQAINIREQDNEEAAQRNVDIINRHAPVLIQIQVSVYKSFVTDLAIFFDKTYEGNFSLKRLLEAAKDTVSEQELVVAQTNVEEIRRKNSTIISFILDLRNKDVVHQEIDRKSYEVIYAEIEELFKQVQRVLNIIDYKHSGSIAAWTHIEEEILRQMNWIFSDLEKGEFYRRKEFEAEDIALLKKLKDYGAS